MKTRWLDRRIASPGPYLALCLSQAELDEAFRHLCIQERTAFISAGANATTHNCDNPEGKPVCIVCIDSREGRTPIEIAGLLIHEAVHVWQRYAMSIGERHPGDEQEAYGIQSIAQELLAEYARRIEG